MSRTVRDEKGMALILVLLVAIAVSALAMGGIVMASAGSLTSKFHYRELALQSAADGGAELARDSLNRNSALLPDTGYVTLQSSGAVLDASGGVIPGITRSVYAGRTGGRTGGAATSGQYGSNYASALSVIQDVRGAVAVRRYLLTEESWSRYAYAMNKWSNLSVAFACGEEAAGPVHSNANIYINCNSAPKVLFRGPVTAVGTIGDKNDATFMSGWSQGVPPVKWPVAADLAKLRIYAQDGGSDYDIDGTVSSNTSFSPLTRIEFVTLDLNNNGIIDKDEGFFKVFQANVSTEDTVLAYVTAKRWPRTIGGGPATAADPNLISRNCGASSNIGGVTRWRSASEIYTATGGTPAQNTTAVQNALTGAAGTTQKRCYLGGDPRLFPAVTFDTLTPDSLTTYMNGSGFGMQGKWLRRSGSTPVPAGLTAKRPGDQQYFFPLQSNVNFKGVIYVRGAVAVSGRVRGRVTVASTGNILLADDVQYSSTPGSDCSETGDMLGVTTPEAVLIEDNNVQVPFDVAGNPTGLFDDSPDNENYHMFIFTLKQFYGDNLSYNGGGGSIAGERCSANSSAKSGCVRVSGGIIQDDVGAATFSSSGHGWAEQHTYDKCGITMPPPYFPTTGRYLQNRIYEIDPIWLNKIGVAAFYRELQSR